MHAMQKKQLFVYNICVCNSMQLCVMHAMQKEPGAFANKRFT